MNKVILMGYLTRDPEVRYTQSDKPLAIARYTLAVNKAYKKEGEPDEIFSHPREERTRQFLERVLPKWSYTI